MKHVPSFLLIISIAFSSSVMATDAFDDYHQGEYLKAKSGILNLAQKNNKEALYYLGKMKIHGYGVTKNEQSGIDNIEKSASLGFLPARLFMGKLRLSENEPAKALHWFKLAARQGDVSALLYVASSYKFGYGTKKNEKQSKHYLYLAAKKGDALARYYLSKHYLNSSRYKSRKIGLNWLKQAARGGDLLAQLELARVYDTGSVTHYLPQQAKFWLDKAKAHKGTYTDDYIGDYFYHAKDLSEQEKALAWYRKGASKSSYAKEKLASMLLSNRFYQNNANEGIRLLQEAANEGNLDAQKALAKRYELGEGVSASESEAKRYQALAKNNPQATLKYKTLAWISYRFNEMEHVAKLDAKTVLPNHGNQLAMEKGKRHIGPSIDKVKLNDVFIDELVMINPKTVSPMMMIENINPTEGVKVISERPFPFYPLKNAKPTQKYFNKLYSKALLGNREAQFELAQYYHFGIGVKKDIPTALSWYYEAAMQHHMGGEYGLGLIYLQGDGVNQDLASAKAWLELSAFKGNPYAQYALGYAHHLGVGDSFSEDGINQDLERAKSLYHLSSSMNIADARYNLANLYAKEGFNHLTAKEKEKRAKLLMAFYENAKDSGIKEAKFPLAFYYLMNSDDPNKLAWAYQEISNSDHPQKSLLLAIMYDKGLGVYQSDRKALAWYEKAKEQNQAAAYFVLGTRLYQNAKNQAEREKAYQMLSKSADLGFVMANYNLAAAYKKANVPHIELVEKAANGEFDKASLYLADNALRNKDSDNHYFAREVYQRLGQKNNAEALLKQAYLLEQGLGGKKDLRKARQLYQKAANLGNHQAQYFLARCYQYGKGTNINPAKALYWYQKAAVGGYFKAYTALGFLYETELSNYNKAKYWYEKALAHDSAAANLNLALIYDYAKGNVGQNQQKALNYYLAAAKQGNEKAYLPLAKYLHQGIGGNASLNNAYHWYLEADSAGVTEAYYPIAMMNELGEGTTRNLSLALTYYQKAADEGDVDALLAVARLLQDGQGIKKDLPEAFNYYEKAAQKGNKFAKYQVAKMRLQGEGVKADKARAIKELEGLKKQNYPQAASLLQQISTIEEEDKVINDMTN